MDKTSDYFINKNIKKVIGKPTREDIKNFLEKTQEDTAAILCELGGGKNGHLCITMID